MKEFNNINRRNIRPVRRPVYHNDIKRGKIYYANLSGSIGSEEKGVRPVLIIQNDVGNEFGKTTIVAPLTTKFKQNNLPMHVPIIIKNLRYSLVMLEQIRVLDKSRLLEYVGRLREKDIQKIDNALKISLYL